MKSVRQTLVILGALGALCAAQVVAAAPWASTAELGVVVTSGNTKTKTINAKAKAVYEEALWRHTLQAAALNTAANGVATAERYLLSGKSDYSLSTKDYVFGLLIYENDRFSGFDYRTAETVGYGRHVLQEPNLTLDLEAGIGARQSKVTTTGDSNNEGLLHLGGSLGWKVSDTSKFTEDLTVDIGQDSTITKSVTALTAQVAGSLAAKLSYTVLNNSDVPAASKNTDTETAVTLVYSF